jgi:hypothetical protein
MFLNTNIPHWQCLLRAEYAYDLQSHHGEFIPVVVFGVASLPCRALGWHAMTERGAVFWRLPISSLVASADAPDLPLDHLQLWDAFSYEIAVTEFHWLIGLRCRTLLKDRQWYDGEYLFTLDWCDRQSSESAGDIGHKCGHVLALDNGCFAIQPNNRILWYEPSFVTNPYADDERPDFKTNTHEWKAERESRWATEATDRYFYDTESP